MAKIYQLETGHDNDIRISHQGDTFVVPEGVTVEFSGVLSGQGPLIKSGPGTLVLTNPEYQHTGDIMVEGGTLRYAGYKRLEFGSDTIIVKGDGTPGSAVLEFRVKSVFGPKGPSKIAVSQGGILRTVNYEGFSDHGATGMVFSSVKDSRTVINVSDAGSALECDGDIYLVMAGEVNVGDGGRIYTTRNIYMGGSGGRLVVYVAGEGSMVEVAQRLVLAHFSADCEVNILAGAVMRGDTISIAGEEQSRNLVNVDGPGARLESSGSIDVGMGGYSEMGPGVWAELNITNGGLVQTLGEAGKIANISIGSEWSDKAVVNVSGPGSQILSTGDISVGGTGQCELNISRGGAALFGGNAYISGQSKGLVGVVGPGSLLASLEPLDKGTDERDTGEYDHDYDVEDGQYDGAFAEAAAADGSESKALYVGYNGPGALKVGSGGTVRTSGNIYAAYGSDTSRADIEISGNDSVIATAGTLFVGYQGQARLQILNGGALLYDDHGISICLGYAATAMGVMELDGSGSEVRLFGNLTVGARGRGFIAVRSGARLELGVHASLIMAAAEGSYGEIAVMGAGSRLYCGNDNAVNYTEFVIGRNGEALLVVNSGAEVTSSTHTVIGDAAGGKGRVIIKGPDTLFALEHRFVIGSSGYGELNVTENAQVGIKALGRDHDLYLGDLAEGHGVLNVNDGGGFLSSGTELIYIGHEGRGEMNVSQGGAVEMANTVYVGDRAGSKGLVALTGDTSRLIVKGDFNVGEHGNAQVMVSHGALLKAENDLYIANSQSKAVLIVDAATVDCGYGLSVGHIGSGSMQVRNGAKVTVADNLDIGDRFGAARGELVIDAAEITCARRVNVGTSGTGRLLLINGGSLAVAESIYITYHEGFASDITVSGAGSRLTADKHMYVGYNGDGTLTISNGGAVTILRDVYVGPREQGSGLLVVDGAGSLLTAGSVIDDEQEGQSEVHVTNGGEIKIVERDHEADAFQDTVDWINSFEFSM